MRRPFNYFLILLSIRQYYFVECYAPGGLIWSRKLQTFVPVVNVPTYGAYEKALLAKSRAKEIHNFRGEVLKLGYFQEDDTVNFYDNDTKITGAYGEMWNILAEYSNFTLVVMKEDRFGMCWNGSGYGVALKHCQNKIQIIPRLTYEQEFLTVMDFTTPIWEIRFKMYIQPTWRFDILWMFAIFSHKVWLAIVVLLVVLSVIGYLMQKISMKTFDDKKYHNLQDHIFYTFATLCSQDFVPCTLDRRSKIIGLSKKIFGWMLLVVFSSHLISYMTNRKLQPPFKDMASLFNNSNYQQLVGRLNRSGLYETWQRAFQYPSEEDLYKTGCLPDKKIAIIDMEDAKRALNRRFCELVPVGKSYFPTWVTFGVSKGLAHKRTFDIGILKMREFGLAVGLKNRWLKPYTTHSEVPGHAPFVPVNFRQVSMLFAVLCIGLIASLAILVVENIVHIYKRKQRRNVREDLFTGKFTLNAYRRSTDDRDNKANVSRNWTTRCRNGIAKYREACLCRLSKVFTFERQ